MCAVKNKFWISIFVFVNYGMISFKIINIEFFNNNTMSVSETYYEDKSHLHLQLI